MDDHEFDRNVQFYEARGTVKARERIQGIVIVAVERALKVTSPAYDIGATEDEFRERSLRRLTASWIALSSRPRGSAQWARPSSRVVSLVPSRWVH